METLYRKKQLLSFFNWYKDDEGELSNNETIVDAYLDSIPETTLTDNAQTLQNALEQIEKLEAENKELLSILKGLVSDVGNLTGEHDIEWQQAGYFESAKEVIQKHKK